MRGIVSTQNNLQKEDDHLARVLKQNAFPANFIRNASAPPTQQTADTIAALDDLQEEDKRPLVGIPYVTGMSENIRCVCRTFNIRVVFKSGQIPHSILTKSRKHIGETKQRLEMRL